MNKRRESEDGVAMVTKIWPLFKTLNVGGVCACVPSSLPLSSTDTMDLCRVPFLSSSRLEEINVL